MLSISHVHSVMNMDCKWREFEEVTMLLSSSPFRIQLPVLSLVPYCSRAFARPQYLLKRFCVKAFMVSLPCLIDSSVTTSGQLLFFPAPCRVHLSKCKR